MRWTVTHSAHAQLHPISGQSLDSIHEATKALAPSSRFVCSFAQEKESQALKAASTSQLNHFLHQHTLENIATGQSTLPVHSFLQRSIALHTEEIWPGEKRLVKAIAFTDHSIQLKPG